MFLGEYHHNLDEKGRLSIPTKFRGDLSRGAVITRGLDGALFLFTKKEWTLLADKLVALPLGKSSSRAFARLMLAGAMDAGLDKQGRLVIPEFLRKFAQIKTHVVIAGLYNRLEVWDEETWEKYKKRSEGEATKLAEQLSEIGL